MFHFSVSLYKFSFPHSFQHFLIPCDFSHLIFFLFTLPSLIFSILTVLAPSYSYCYLSYKKNCFYTYPQGSSKKLKRTKAKPKKTKSINNCLVQLTLLAKILSEAERQVALAGQSVKKVLIVTCQPLVIS